MTGPSCALTANGAQAVKLEGVDGHEDSPILVFFSNLLGSAGARHVDDIPIYRPRKISVNQLGGFRVTRWAERV